MSNKNTSRIISRIAQFAIANNKSIDNNNELMNDNNELININNDAIHDLQNNKQDVLTSDTDIVGNTLSIDPYGNKNSVISKLRLGRVVGGGANEIYLSHYDNFTFTDFALRQDSNGTTTINAKDNESIHFNVNNSPKMTVTSEGFIGIGKTNPDVPLHITGSEQHNVSGSSFQILDGQHIIKYTHINNRDISLLVENGTVTDILYVGDGIYISSDSRIKKNITDIDDELALTQIRKVKPKTYKYIDQRHDETVIGFIAQDIKEDIPLAHTQRTNKIPNIMKIATIQDNIITFYDDVNLEYDDDGDVYKTIIIYDFNKNEISLKIENIIDSKNIKVESTQNITTDVNNNVIVYGQVVHNFNCIDKSYIYTINVAATQELDRQLQTEKNKVIVLEKELQTEKNKVNDLHNQINSILKRLDELEKN